VREDQNEKIKMRELKDKKRQEWMKFNKILQAVQNQLSGFEGSSIRVG
jgi:hypothetical protein